jgi:hypothetical protein
MFENIVSVVIAGLFSVLFLAMFPTINTLLRSIPVPVGILPLAGAIMVAMPYLICFSAALVAITIIRHRIQN